jgi:hypothetical protein
MLARERPAIGPMLTLEPRLPCNERFAKSWRRVPRNKLTPRFCESHAPWRLRWRPSREGDLHEITGGRPPGNASESRCSGEWNDDDSTCWPMAGLGRIFEANAGRNEVVCKTVCRA